ncbi:MAG: hypothetical protein HYS05_12580, partial [Acidobacteria bacterium]|nr:hypothetical protein [Acidobacteriota bacterium]
QRLVRGHQRGPRGEAEVIGRQLGADLLSRGADALLEEARNTTARVEGLQP